MLQIMATWSQSTLWLLKMRTVTTGRYPNDLLKYHFEFSHSVILSLKIFRSLGVNSKTFRWLTACLKSLPHKFCFKYNINVPLTFMRLFSFYPLLRLCCDKSWMFFSILFLRQTFPEGFPNHAAFPLNPQ